MSRPITPTPPEHCSFPPTPNHSQPPSSSLSQHTETHIIIPPKQFCFFTYNHSQIIRQISAQSSTLLEIDYDHQPPAGKLNISGTLSHVSHCKRLIDERIHHLRGEKPISMWIPVDKIGLIVGVRGVTIRDINSRSGAYATVKNHNIDHDRKLIQIHGPPPAAECARDMISEILADRRLSNSYPEQEKQTVRISVPHYAVGAIIGRGGSNVRKINMRTGVYIKVESVGPDFNGNEDKQVVLTGDPSRLEEAEMMVKDIVHQREIEEDAVPSSRFPPHYADPPSEQFLKNDSTEQKSHESEEYKVRLSISEIDIIVGQEGSVLEDIKMRSRTVIEFSLMDKEQGSDEQTVYITGAQTGILIALILIEERLGMSFGTLTDLVRRPKASHEKPGSRFRERPPSPVDGKEAARESEKCLSDDYYDCPQQESKATTTKRCLESSKDSPQAGTGRFDEDNSHLHESSDKRILKNPSSTSKVKEVLESGEIGADEQRTYDESRLSTEPPSSKQTVAESTVGVEEPEDGRKESGERVSRRARSSGKEIRKHRKHRKLHPAALQMHPSSWKMPHPGQMVPMYPIRRAEGEPYKMFNRADPHAYPMYPGMHPMNPHFFVGQQASSPAGTESSEESSSDDEYVDKASVDNANVESSITMGNTVADVRSTAHSRERNDRNSDEVGLIRKRRKKQHKFAYGYPGTDAGLIPPHPLAMYPGYHYPLTPPMQDGNHESMARRQRRHFSRSRQRKETPSPGIIPTRMSKSSEALACNPRGADP